MKILIVTHNFPPIDGGIATHVSEIARNLHALGQVPIVVAPSSERTKQVDAQLPYEVVRMPASRSRYVRLFITGLYTLSLMLLRNPRYVYSSHWKNSGVAAAICCFLCSKPLFQAVHGSEATRLHAGRSSLYLFRWVASIVRGFVVSGKYQVDLISEAGVPKSKILVAPQGVDLTRFSTTRPHDPPIRERYGIGENPILLTVARLVERKGHDVVLKALRQVLADEPDTTYLIVGKGPMEGALRRLADEYDVTERVIFCGFVPDAEIPLYYYSCDMFVMVSRDIGGDVEGFGISFIEAGACGKVVVGGRSGGIPDVIEDGVTGYLVDPSNAEELARVVINGLRNRELREAMGEAARTRVEHRYDWRVIVANMLAYFRARGRRA